MSKKSYFDRAKNILDIRKKNTPAHSQIEEHQKNAKKHKIKGAAVLGGRHDSWRFFVVAVIMLLGGGSLMARAYYLQIANSQFYIDKGNEFITSVRIQSVNRGMITDTFGNPLAANAPLVTVVFSPYDYAQSYYQARKRYQTAKTDESKQAALAKLDSFNLDKLSQLTGYPADKLHQAVAIDERVDLLDAKSVNLALPTGAGSHRIVLLSRTTPEVAKTVMELGVAGVSEERQSRRFYLQAEPNAQVLGFMAGSDVDNQYKGRAGIESQYESVLAGKDGKVLVLKNAGQYALKQLAQLEPEVEGKDVALTLDARLQYVLYKELEQVGREQKARWASGMVVDVHTGDVLAMGSWPSFNSNNLGERTGVNERNRPVLDVFEPGSVMKPFTVAAALESGKYNTNTLIDTGGGSLNVGGSTIRDGGAYGAITLSKLIQKSSNVASAKIALNLPASAMADMQKQFGFGQKTALNFPAEASGKVDTPRASETARRATLSYGYGQQVTLAQIAQAYATLGAGGVMHPLRLVKDEPMPPARQVISDKHAKEIVGMMELVTMQGSTGKAAAIDGYRVAGKTGTSRRTSPKGGYAKGEYRTIFAGVAPVSNPRFAVAILVEDPRKQFSAGPVAGPVFSKVMRETLRLYNVPMDKPLNDTLSTSKKS